MDELEYALEWLHFAEMDLGSAEYLIGYKPLPVEIICFHSQQAAEKCLKGVLVIHKIVPPKTHNLEELCLLCAPYLENADRVKIACSILNPYGIQPRYPREMKIGEDDVKAALKYAKTVLDFLKPLFPERD